MSTSVEEVDLEEIGEDEVDEMAEKTGLDPEILQSSIDTQRADEKYEKYEQDESEPEGSTRSRLEKAKTFVRFLGNSAVRNPTLPRLGTVTEVDAKDSEDQIQVTVEVTYPELPYENPESDTMVQTITYDLNEEKGDLDFILQKAGVSKPSQLEDEKVPVFLRSEEKLGSMEVPTFRIPDRNDTLEEKFNYNLLRTLYRIKAFERCGSNTEAMDEGEFFINRNIFLSLSLAMLLSGGLVGAIGEFASIGYLTGVMYFIGVCSGIIAGLYLIAVLSSFASAASSYATNPEGERDYIRDFINK